MSFVLTKCADDEYATEFAMFPVGMLASLVQARLKKRSIEFSLVSMIVCSDESVGLQVMSRHARF